MTEIDCHNLAAYNNRVALIDTLLLTGTPHVGRAGLRYVLRPNGL